MKRFSTRSRDELFGRAKKKMKRNAYSNRLVHQEEQGSKLEANDRSREVMKRVSGSKSFHPYHTEDVLTIDVPDLDQQDHSVDPPYEPFELEKKRR